MNNNTSPLLTLCLSIDKNLDYILSKDEINYIQEFGESGLVFAYVLKSDNVRILAELLSYPKIYIGFLQLCNKTNLIQKTISKFKAISCFKYLLNEIGYELLFSDFSQVESFFFNQFIEGIQIMSDDLEIDLSAGKNTLLSQSFSDNTTTIIDILLLNPYCIAFSLKNNQKFHHMTNLKQIINKFPDFFI